MAERSFEDQVIREAVISKAQRLARLRARKARISIALKYRLGWGPKR